MPKPSEQPQPDADLGARRTRQRDAVVEIISRAEGPLSVPQLLEMANLQGGKVGVATIYRTVKLLLEAGRIQAVTLPDGALRYERAELGHHHHFHCTRCDRVFDLSGCPVRIEPGDLPKGFSMDSHEVTLTGRCSDCGKVARAGKSAVKAGRARP